MSIRWTADKRRYFIRVTPEHQPAVGDYLAMIRGVATVTNQSGGYAILLDFRYLDAVPGYADVVNLAQEVWRLRSPLPDFVAVLVVPSGSIYGKARQAVSVLSAVGILVELFTDEAAALDWLGTMQPLAAPVDTLH